MFTCWPRRPALPVSPHFVVLSSMSVFSMTAQLATQLQHCCGLFSLFVSPPAPETSLHCKQGGTKVAGVFRWRKYLSQTNLRKVEQPDTGQEWPGRAKSRERLP